MQFNCEYSNPVDYQGQVPITDLTAWNFRTASCSGSLDLASASSSLTTNTATSSGLTLDPSVSNAIGSFMWVTVVFYMIVIVYIAWRQGLWIFRR